VDAIGKSRVELVMDGIGPIPGRELPFALLMTSHRTNLFPEMYQAYYVTCKAVGSLELV
jgi:hypothetical protein